MRSASDLKQIFQEGWNIPARVDNYVRTVAQTEFAEGGCLHAWRTTLNTVLGAADRLKVLDVGTGPGVFACLYAQMGHDCTGLDFSGRMLAAARQRAEALGAACSFVLGDAEDPPFPSRMFDLVSSRHLLFNLPRPGVAVRQWVRVLKPGGKMILIGDEPELEQSPRRALRAKRVLEWCLARFARDRSPGWRASPEYINAVSECPLFRHTSGSIRAVMEAAGLQDLHSCPTDNICSARLASRPMRSRRRFPNSRPFILIGVKP